MQRNRTSAGRAGPGGGNLWMAAVIVAAIAVALYFWFRSEPEPVMEEPVAVDPEEEWAPFWDTEVAEQAPRYRVPEVVPPREPEAEEVEEDPLPVDEDVRVVEPLAPEEPLPSLEESDEPLKEKLAGLTDEQQLWELFVPEFIIRHFVVTIDNMTAAKLPQQYSIANPPPGSFTVRDAADETYYLDTRNFDRYRRYVELAETIDIGRAVALYVRYYPLFQQAYEELGYSRRYFNDRLVEVIEHLLATPRVEGPIELVRPKVYYEFADPELEALSAGQKLLVRTGPDNAARIKSRLRELRTALTTLDAESGSDGDVYEYIPPPP